MRNNASTGCNVKGDNEYHERSEAELSDVVAWLEEHHGAERIRRFATHHVELLADHFTVEHPPTCDLTQCRLYEALRDMWSEPPGPLGWYEVDEFGAISRAQERGTYLVVRMPQ